MPHITAIIQRNSLFGGTVDSDEESSPPTTHPVDAVSLLPTVTDALPSLRLAKANGDIVTQLCETEIELDAKRRPCSAVEMRAS
jgi:hypothetical protein